MSENKGTYVFSPKVLNKRIEELKQTPPSEKDQLITKLIDLSDQLAAMAGVMMIKEVEKPTYTDEEVRELARHLNAVIKAYHNDNSQDLPAAQVRDAEGFLRSKKYFKLNQSDLIV